MITPDSPRALLPDVLLEFQRQAVLDELAAYGQRLDGWDGPAVDEAADAAWDIMAASPVGAVPTLYEAFGTLAFEEEADFWDEAERPVYKGEILGHPGFSLMHAGTNFSYIRRHVMVFGEKDESGYPSVVREYNVSDDVDGLLKYIRIALHDTEDFRPAVPRFENAAAIFTAPDLPPVAAMLDNLLAMDKYYGFYDADSPMSLNRIAQEIGPHAVHFLSDETCDAVITAMRTAPKMLASPFS